MGSEVSMTRCERWAYPDSSLFAPQCPHHANHRKSREGRFDAPVLFFPRGALARILHVIHSEHLIYDGYPILVRHVHASPYAFIRHLLEMICFPFVSRTESDNRLK